MRRALQTGSVSQGARHDGAGHLQNVDEILGRRANARASASLSGNFLKLGNMYVHACVLLGCAAGAHPVVEESVCVYLITDPTCSRMTAAVSLL